MLDPEVNLQDKLHSAISHALADAEPDENALVSRWVLSVERLHEQGSSVSYIASEGMANWEVIGMTEATSEMARAQLAYNIGIYDDDDDDEDEDD